MKEGNEIRILLGKYVENGSPFHWEPLKSVNPHLLISGTSGAGKSQTLMNIVYQYRKNRIPVLIFDIHGEYQEVGDLVIDFRKNVRINPLNCPGETPMELAFEIRDVISQIYKRIGYVQKDLLYKAILEAYKQCGILPQEEIKGKNVPDFDDVYSVILGWEEDNPKDRSLAGLISRLRPVFEFRIFAGPEALSIPELLKPKVFVFDLSTMPSEEIQRLAVVFTLRKIWSHIYHMGTHKGIRLSMVLDEAYKYAFEGSPLIPILREGRKFGISVLLASQMLNDFPEAVTANVGTKIVLSMRSHNEKRRAVKELGLKSIEELDRATKGRFHSLILYLGEVHWVRLFPYFEIKEGISDEGKGGEVDRSTRMAILDGAFLKELLGRKGDIWKSLQENLRVRHSLADLDLALKVLKEGREGEHIRGNVYDEISSEARRRYLSLKEKDKKEISLLLRVYEKFGHRPEAFKGEALRLGFSSGPEEVERKAVWAFLASYLYVNGKRSLVIHPFSFEFIEDFEIREEKEERVGIEDSLPIKCPPERARLPDLVNSYVLKVEEFKLILRPYWRCNFKGDEEKGTLIVDGISGEVLEEVKRRRWLLEVVKGKIYRGKKYYKFPSDLKIEFPKEELDQAEIEEIVRSYLINEYGEGEYKISLERVLFPMYYSRIRSVKRTYVRKISAYSGREIEDEISYCPLHKILRPKAYAVCEVCGRAFCQRHIVEVNGHYYCVECAKKVLKE